MLTKEILCAYLPYEVEVVLSQEGRYNLDSEYPNEHQYKKGRITEFSISENGDIYGEFKVSDRYYFSFNELSEIQLCLRPLSSLTKPITHNGETFVFTELFEIGDDGGFIYDFGNGNTKLINNLESIAKYNCYHDINYLPYPVVKLMYEYHFDINGLLESGHAIELKEE